MSRKVVKAPMKTYTKKRDQKVEIKESKVVGMTICQTQGQVNNFFSKVKKQSAKALKGGLEPAAKAQKLDQNAPDKPILMTYI